MSVEIVRMESNHKDRSTLRGPQSSGGRNSVNFQLSVPIEDLSREALLASAKPIPFNGTTVPSLGGIALLARLGQGGMGAVYYGAHMRLMKEVAVKVLTLAEKSSSSSGHAQRFYREAQLAAQIQSPHLIGVLDVNEENGVLYMVMEYVRGKNGHELLQSFAKEFGSAALPEAIALDICIAATEGLAKAHIEGVIHRDIKPGNIMIPYQRGSSELNFVDSQLSDLGLGRSEATGPGMTVSGAVMGTPGFMSPEQAEESTTCGKPSDVFGMGATLYAFLSGAAPFEGATMMKVLLKTVETPHVPIHEVRKDISLPTVELLELCLKKSAKQRFVDGSALLQGLKLCRAALDNAADEVQTINAVMALSELAQSKEAGKVLSPRTTDPRIATTLKSAPAVAAPKSPSAYKAAPTNPGPPRPAMPVLPASLSFEEPAKTPERFVLPKLPVPSLQPAGPVPSPAPPKFIAPPVPAVGKANDWRRLGIWLGAAVLAIAAAGFAIWAFQQRQNEEHELTLKEDDSSRERKRLVDDERKKMEDEREKKIADGKRQEKEAKDKLAAAEAKFKRELEQKTHEAEAAQREAEAKLKAKAEELAAEKAKAEAEGKKQADELLAKKAELEKAEKKLTEESEKFLNLKLHRTEGLEKIKQNYAEAMAARSKILAAKSALEKRAEIYVANVKVYKNTKESLEKEYRSQFHISPTVNVEGCPQWRTPVVVPGVSYSLGGSSISTPAQAGLLYGGKIQEYARSCEGLKKNADMLATFKPEAEKGKKALSELDGKIDALKAALDKLQPTDAERAAAMPGHAK